MPAQFQEDYQTQPGPAPQAGDTREMLEQALAAEKRAITDYSERLCHVEGFGDVGLKVVLENQVADETRHKGNRTNSRRLE